MFVRPWLHQTHPNFMVSFGATLGGHLWAAYLGLFGPRKGFDVPSLAQVNDAAAPKVWGAVSLVAATLMLAGLFRPTFDLARLGLAIGLVWFLARAVLVAFAAHDGEPTGLALPSMLILVGLHLSQTLEPPRNPETARDG